MTGVFTSYRNKKIDQEKSYICKAIFTYIVEWKVWLYTYVLSVNAEQFQQ